MVGLILSPVSVLRTSEFRVVLERVVRCGSTYFVFPANALHAQWAKPGGGRDGEVGRWVGGDQRWDVGWVGEAVDSNAFGIAKGSEPSARLVAVLVSQLLRASLAVVVLFFL